MKRAKEERDFANVDDLLMSGSDSDQENMDEIGENMDEIGEEMKGGGGFFLIPQANTWYLGTVPVIKGCTKLGVLGGRAKEERRRRKGKGTPPPPLSTAPPVT